MAENAWGCSQAMQTRHQRWYGASLRICKTGKEAVEKATGEVSHAIQAPTCFFTGYERSDDGKRQWQILAVRPTVLSPLLLAATVSLWRGGIHLNTKHQSRQRSRLYRFGLHR